MAYVLVPGNKGINISLMAAISINEIVGFHIQANFPNSKPQGAMENIRDIENSTYRKFEI